MRRCFEKEHNIHLFGKHDYYHCGNGNTIHWAKFCRENGMRNINFHTLRHTFATSALEAGVDVKTLSEMLGHASTSTTMDLYCHPTMKHKKDCMKKIWGRGHDEP